MATEQTKRKVFERRMKIESDTRN